MSAKKIKTKAAAQSTNPFLFETSLATLQTWIGNHEKLGRETVPNIIAQFESIDIRLALLRVENLDAEMIEH